MKVLWFKWGDIVHGKGHNLYKYIDVVERSI